MKKRQQSGFTLIEMMVVLVIMGVIVSMMVISLNTKEIKEEMEVEMTRIQVLITLAQEEAILQGQVMALAVSENTYRFDVLNVEDETWRPVLDEKIFRERPVVQGTSFSLVIDEIEKEARNIEFKRELSLQELKEKEQRKKERQNKDEEEDKYQRVYIEPSGEMFPFELILRTEDDSVEVKLILGHDGEMKIVMPEDFS